MPVVIAVIGTAFAIVIAIILLKRRGTPKFDIAVADDQDVAALLPALAGLTGGVVFRGNAVTVNAMWAC